jgi:hypothetical protein
MSDESVRWHVMHGATAPDRRPSPNQADAINSEPPPGDSCDAGRPIAPTPACPPRALGRQSALAHRLRPCDGQGGEIRGALQTPHTADGGADQGLR